MIVSTIFYFNNLSDFTEILESKRLEHIKKLKRIDNTETYLEFSKDFLSNRQTCIIYTKYLVI